MGKARSAPVSQPGWYVETTADGGAHYGRIVDPDPRASARLSVEAALSLRIVEANCGRTFRPLDHALRHGVPFRVDEPTDECHACPECWEKVHGKGTSFYEVAGH